ncbi:hypothetical protein J5N97_002250 [Dioscorea zingiberensis]|uniref:Pectate lyase N-terminal domain-containing protein n=1 Tax=Dioscorea zingiberensis TaxID=325984 RepID=A0A9D5D3D3_9LILI|nr:hypothetical protein J5N97_002250 [Dioscorea zingiberensis]
MHEKYGRDTAKATDSGANQATVQGPLNGLGESADIPKLGINDMDDIHVENVDARHQYRKGTADSPGPRHVASARIREMRTTSDLHDLQGTRSHVGSGAGNRHSPGKHQIAISQPLPSKSEGKQVEIVCEEADKMIRTFLLFFFFLLLACASLSKANIADFDETWQKRAEIAKEKAHAAYVEDPETVTNSFNADVNRELDTKNQKTKKRMAM